MRKAQKAQAEEFVKLLEEAQQEIKLDIETGSTAEALDLLGQCQQGAIELGTLIETLEGEGFVTVGYLEKYCEVVFEIYQALEQAVAEQEAAEAGRNGNATAENMNIDAEAVYSLLTGQLTQVKESIERDIKVRKEVVFLPYKASMWDSLESVWKAAVADPDCDAYVIPIPYYDKNQDGSFREYHYEGTQYPGYVPVIWYENYNFAERQPDQIFIHNPYDHCNIVTSVHPFFYSQNLKQFTEELVYIPYFILAEVDPENERAVEAIEHYIAMPGVQNADKVIVQSEAMRQAYIKVMVKYTGEAKRAYWEDKIFGLGSPKVDKVLNTRKEDLDIPAQWLDIIQKPDGSWKKIIFYNTTVTALLNHNEQMLLKIRDVLRVFKENRENVALLWRPHPLMKATIEAMRPRLWEEYNQIVEQYKAEGWGIYDDTADLDRAVAICDGYYGDHSSVVGLCQAVGKPVMVQDCNILV